MKRHSPEAQVTRRTADYVERVEQTEEQGEVRFIDVQGRFPEAGSETAEEDLRVTGLEGEGKIAIGGSYAVLAKNAIVRVGRKHNFWIEGSPVTVAIAPDL